MIKIFKGICDKAQIQANDFLKKVDGKISIMDGNIVVEYSSADKVYTFPIPIGVNYYTDDQNGCFDIVKLEVFEDNMIIHTKSGYRIFMTKDENNITFLQDEGYEKERLIKILPKNNIDVDYEFEMVESEKYNVDNWKELFAKFPNISYDTFSNWINVNIIPYGILNCQTEKLDYLIRHEYSNQIKELIKPLIERLSCVGDNNHVDNAKYLKFEEYAQDIEMQNVEQYGGHGNLILEGYYYFGKEKCSTILSELSENALNGIVLMLKASRSRINKLEGYIKRDTSNMYSYEQEEYINDRNTYNRVKKLNDFLAETYKKVKDLKLKIAKFDAINII